MHPIMYIVAFASGFMFLYGLLSLLLARPAKQAVMVRLQALDDQHQKFVDQRNEELQLMRSDQASKVGALNNILKHLSITGQV
ncbi:unnamed protein product, partial [marine sediment metagenome]